MENMKKAMVFLLLVSLAAFQVSAQFASITNTPRLYFTGTSSSPGTLYQDGVDGNSDVGIELCDLGQRYVGATYAVRINGTFQYVLTSYYSSATALSYTDSDEGGGCYEVTPGFITISPSQLTTPDPDVYKAAFPGNVWITYAASANPGTLSNFIYPGSSDAQYRGSYTFARSFTEATRDITVSEPTITFTTSSGSFSKTTSNANYGISDANGRRMVIGVCEETTGYNCSDGEVLTASNFPTDYGTGLTSGEVNDQNTHTRYVVINGMGYSMCIGANLQATINTVDPDPVYYSQTLNITMTFSNPRNTPYETNGGNVEVTSTFNVLVTIYETANTSNIVYSNSFAITNNLVPSASVQAFLNWPAYQHSGTYTVKVEVDSDSDITECNEADNTDTENFELKAITLPDIFIDGVETDAFPTANVPYNLSFYFKNSDNDTLANATVQITEVNGLSIMAPSQIYNRSTGINSSEKDALSTKSIVEFQTDYAGNISFTFVPTYNNLFLPRYSYLNLTDYMSSYSLYMDGEQEDGESFMFVLSGQLSTTYPFSITTTDYQGAYNQKSYLNQAFVTQIFDFIHQTFANFLRTVVNY